MVGWMYRQMSLSDLLINYLINYIYIYIYE